jgi:serine/threonine protein phosphatase PrpC
MTATTARAAVLRAAGATDPGLQRDNNEDRFHVDEARGLFMVIDGVGGQAAGGEAAALALSMLRARLERETGPVDERVREAIAVANNEIHRAAASRPDWKGMACVLTVAVIKDGVATVGHVGDTRLYKIRQGRIEKITRDHSPVGEREDAGELSEADAMRHPRRNEVYRDVGSEPHQPGDADFVDIATVPVEPDAALLLCSDGLSDLVPSGTISAVAARLAADPSRVVRGLVEAANDAGGKDNVTAVFIAGERVRRRCGGAGARGASEPGGIAGRAGGAGGASAGGRGVCARARGCRAVAGGVGHAAVAVGSGVIVVERVDRFRRRRAGPRRQPGDRRAGRIP